MAERRMFSRKLLGSSEMAAAMNALGRSRRNREER